MCCRSQAITAVVAGVVFFAVRALLALIPQLTTGLPIKKWSAAAACRAAFICCCRAPRSPRKLFFMTAVV